VVQRDEELLPRLRARKAEHPCWGSRRIWAYLPFVEHHVVNKKRGRRLMREHHLLVPPTLKLKAKRTPAGRKPHPTKPHEWWGIEMTKVMVEGVGWISIVVVLDWYTKTMVGHDAGLRCTAQHGLQAIDRAVKRQFPEGVRGQGLSLMSDHGCHPTAAAFRQACSFLGIAQAFTSDNNPKGNADTERMMRTLKAECLWLHEWTCPVTVISALESWIPGYNDHDLHSALGYKSPRPFERDYHSRHSPPFVAA
jgi:transposase InsO family protein